MSESQVRSTDELLEELQQLLQPLLNEAGLPGKQPHYKGRNARSVLRDVDNRLRSVDKDREMILGAVAMSKLATGQNQLLLHALRQLTDKRPTVPDEGGPDNGNDLQGE